MKLPAAEMMYEVSYSYNYNGTAYPKHEHLKESDMNKIEESISKGLRESGVFYDNLVVIQELGLMDISNLEVWFYIGLQNLWISEATDPEFSYSSFFECKTIDYLIEKLKVGNWCLGQAFYHRNICFINQIDGGDEWLVIRDGISFESWSCGRVIEENPEAFKDTLNRMFAATDEQLKKLEYMDAGPVTTCSHCSCKLYPGSSRIHRVDEKDTCENCWTNKKFYMEFIVNKVKAGERLTQSDLKPIHYQDIFYACGIDGRLIYWDEKIAIGTTSMSDFNSITIQTSVDGNWIISDEYQVQEECLAER